MDAAELRVTGTDQALPQPRRGADHAQGEGFAR